MSAIEHCRSAALGGHVLQCQACDHIQIAYNSCRNRHCPKCQATAARRWLDARQADLLPVEYYHVVFTLPAPIRDIAWYNKSVVYGILFKAAAETLLTIAGDPRHLGARIGATGRHLQVEGLPGEETVTESKTATRRSMLAPHHFSPTKNHVGD